MKLVKKVRGRYLLGCLLTILAVFALAIPVAALETSATEPPVIEENDPTYGAEYAGYFAISTAEEIRWFYHHISEENSYAKALLVKDIEINTRLFENKITLSPDGEPNIKQNYPFARRRA